MGKVTMAGAGGGADLDVITAAANDVLAGKVIVGPDGEPLTGTLALTGTAADSQVLAGQTYYNTDTKSKRTGAMANRGAVSQALNAGGSYTIPAGYHNGSGKVTANSLASQTSGNATAAQIYNGYTAWVNGSKVTGTMPAMGGQTITPGAAQQTVNCVGKYMTGNIVVQGVQKYAVKIGSYTPSTQTKQFKIRDNGGTVNLYYIRITNLGFTPTGFTAFRYYEERDYSITSSYSTILVQKRNGGDSCSQYPIDRGDFSSAALDIPVWGIGTYYNVIVFGYY